MKNYKIAVAGTGYVGLSLGVLFAQHHQVVAVDIVQAKVDMINNKKSPIQDDYIEKYLAEKDLNLTATLDAKASYRQANESDFIIADAAARYFKAHGITKLPARKALQAEIEQLISEKDGLYNTYHEQKQRFKELQTVKRNIDQILRREEPRRRKEQSHER